MPDPFRTDLRAHYLALEERCWRAERGSPEYWALEKAMFATSRLYGVLFGEAIKPVHEAGPRSKTPLPRLDGDRGVVRKVTGSLPRQRPTPWSVRGRALLRRVTDRQSGSGCKPPCCPSVSSSNAARPINLA